MRTPATARRRAGRSRTRRSRPCRPRAKSTPLAAGRSAGPGSSRTTCAEFHRAFGYLADRYRLRQIPIAGISPEVEPDARSLEAIAAQAKAEGVTTIFLETIAPADLATTVAREIGADLDVLDPIEGVEGEAVGRSDNYARIMRENLEHLTRGLGCQP